MSRRSERASTPAGEQALEEHLITVPGERAVRVQLRGRGPLLLMVNGIGAHIDMWEPLAVELSRTRRLVLFDAPGVGKSLAPARPMRMSGISELVVQLLDALEIKRVDVLGYSWGGALAQQLAHDHPDRVHRLILVATLPGVGGWPPKLRVAAAMLSPARYRSSARGRELAAEIYGGDYRLVAGRAPRKLPHAWHANPPTVRGYGLQLYAISGWSSIPWLHRIRSSTLIITGTEDPLVPRLNARILARLIPRSELHVIPRAGHLWLLDYPVQGAELVERFLSQTDTTSRTSRLRRPRSRRVAPPVSERGPETFRLQRPPSR
jgi:poly(3-hydroxyalkanoate) depolymerase